MNRAFIILFSPLIFLCGFISGQEISNEYGNITSADFALSPEGFLEDAEAVVIYDIGESKFINVNYSFDINFERKTRIKIFEESAIEHATVEIPFYKSDNVFEKIKNIEAITYNEENGEITTSILDPANVYEEKVSEYWYIKKFTMPAVKAGSVIEYRYLHYTTYLFHLQDWEFQRTIPTLHSEYNVWLIPFYNYIYLLQGTRNFDIRESHKESGLPHQFGAVEYHAMIHRFGMKNVPAFKDESFITTKKDYIVKLDFQLTKAMRYDGTTQEILTTWDKLIKRLLENENFGQFQNAMKRKTGTIVKEMNLMDYPEEERFEMIVDYVKDHFKWNKIKSKYARKKPAEFMNEKTGTSGEINLTLAGFLEAADFEVYPLIISTRDHGKILIDYPFVELFNYVIVFVKVNGNWLVTDGTGYHLPNNKIPSYCFNDAALVIKKKEEKWIELGESSPSAAHHNFSVQINDLFDSAYIDIDNIYNLYLASSLKDKAGSDENKLESIFEINSCTEPDSLNIQHSNARTKPYIISFQTACILDQVEGNYLVQPFFGIPLSVNPMKEKTRNLPIDMIYPSEMNYFSSITIPKDYKLISYPENIQIDDENTILIYSVSETSDTTVTVLAKYGFKKSIYDAQLYGELREFYQSTIDKLNGYLVFSRQEETDPKSGTE